MIGGNVSRFFQKGQITPDSRLCPFMSKQEFLKLIARFYAKKAFYR